MKRIFALISIILMASCATQQPMFVGTGVINGKPVELQTKVYSEGTLTAKGWTLFVSGEDMGVLYYDGKSDGKRQEFLPLQTKYGVFDGVAVTTFSTSVSFTFSITLDGEYVGTASGSI